MDETMSEDVMTLNVINKIISKLKFLNFLSFLTLALRRLPCNASIHRRFYYACSAWYPNLTKTLKHIIAITKIKYMSFCLQLYKLKHLSHENFKHLNWLPMTYRLKQCGDSIVFKYFNGQCTSYLDELLDFATESRFKLSSFQKSKCPFSKTYDSQFALS